MRGRNWTRSGLDTSEHIAKIVIDPTRCNNMYVAVPGTLWSDSPHRGLYKTTDGGDTWDKILTPMKKRAAPMYSMDPRNPNVCSPPPGSFAASPYAFNSGGPGSALYKSTDGGKTWRELTNGLPTKPFGRMALALAPSAPR